MKLATGRFREQTLYLRYVAALLRPGREVPVFDEPRDPSEKLSSFSNDDRRIVIDEARQQLARQREDVQRNHTRAATLLTVALAELAYAAASGPAIVQAHWSVIVLWALSGIAALLALAGAIAVLTVRADYGIIDTAAMTGWSPPLLPRLAREYATAVGPGEATNNARLTVLRDAVFLAVISALLLAPTTPFSRKSEDPVKDCATNATAPCIYRGPSTPLPTSSQAEPTAVPSSSVPVAPSRRPTTTELSPEQGSISVPHGFAMRATAARRSGRIAGFGARA